MGYDGSIRINTEIETKDANAQMLTLENKITKTADKIQDLRSKLDSMGEAKLPTEEYSEIQKQISKATTEIDHLINKQQAMAQNGEQGTAAFEKIDLKIEELHNELEYANAELQDLVDTGKAFTLGSDSDAYKKTAQNLKYAENEMKALQARHTELESKQRTVKRNFVEMGESGQKALKKISKSATESAGAIGNFAKKIKSIVAQMFVFDLIRKGFRAVIDGIKEGLSNLYNSDSGFKAQIDSLNASLTTLKNTMAAAFAPIISAIIPYIQQLVDWLTIAIDKLAQFFAILSGKGTYTKAVKQAADDMKKAGSAAKGSLASFDKLNNINSNKSGGASEVTQFEEVPVDPKFASWLAKVKDLLKPIVDYCKELWDMFKQGFWDAMGDPTARLQIIKDAIQSIKDSLKDIFTDPQVLAAADAWAKSLAYMLGSLVGMFASIGLTIAANLLGGLAQYLEENKDRIKQYLIDMFDVWTDINYLLAGLFQSIAFVFEAFASEEGITFTANLIGIFAEAFMGVTELASKMIRDLLTVIIQPFVDNKEGFQEALTGFLGVVGTVLGTVKDAIADTFDKLIEVYDEHFTPLFESIAQGISDLTASFLEFWNGSVSPMLQEWADKFDELWKSHIQPFIDELIVLLGDVADLIKALWETNIQPFIQWIIDNVLPMILPILDTLWTTLVEVVGSIGDLLKGMVETISGIIEFITALINGDWDAAWKAAQKIVQGAIDMIMGVVSGFVAILKGIITLLASWLSTTITAIATSINNIVQNGTDKVKEVITNVKTYITDAIKSAKENWTSMWTELWDGFKQKVSDIWEGIKSTIQSAIESISSAISSLVSSFSSLGNIKTSVQTMGGKIPGHANGAVVPRNATPYLAILGDNNRETEIVSPLSTMKQAMIEALRSTGGVQGSGSIGDIVVQIDGKEVFRAVRSQNQQFINSNGVSAFA